MERFNPFPGLRSFEEHEDHLFFGREKDLDELLRRLRTTRFLAVLGTSGSGKSSLVKSGLIPSLYSGFMSGSASSWRIAVMRPGEDPIGHLARVLNRPGVLAGDDGELSDMNASILESTLRRGNLGLVQCIEEARLGADDRLLIVVDQFEELFRFKHGRIEDSRDDAVAFVRLLLAVRGKLSGEELPIYVVLTMRSDFIGHCTEFPGLTEAVNHGQYLVPLLGREERRRAIVGPVAVGGGKISPRLVLRLLNDVGDDPDQLPILQHALMRTWEFWERDHQAGEPLDLRHYEAIGTLKEALDRHAEEAYAELGGEGRQKVAEQLFKSLTEKSPDSGRGVRRPTRLAEICETAGVKAAEIEAVVDVFRQPGRTFVMPPHGTELYPASVLDISHESLMRVWKRLISWVDEETEAASFYFRLSEAAKHHAAGTAALWRDPELGLGLQWRDRHQPTAAWAARYDSHFERATGFLESSRKEEQRRIASRERERQQKLRRARMLSAVLASAALVTLAFGAWAMRLKGVAESEREAAREQQRIAVEERLEADRQRDEAQRQRLEAEHQRLEALNQRQEADRQRDLADQEKQAADQARVEAVAQRQVAQEQKEIAEQKEKEARTQKQLAEDNQRIAETQRQVAESERDKAERAEKVASRLRRVAEAKSLAAQTQNFQDPSISELAALLALEAYRINQGAGGKAEDPEIYNALRLTSGRLASSRPDVAALHRTVVRAVAMAPDGQTVASGSDDGEIRLSLLGGPAEPSVGLGPLPGGVRSLAFSSDGQWLAAGSRDGELWGWGRGAAGGAQNASRPSPWLALRPSVIGGTFSVNALVFKPATAWVVAGDTSGQIKLWNLDAETEPTEMTPGGSYGEIRDLAIRADGAALAAASSQGLLLWDDFTSADVTGGGEGPRTLDEASDFDSVAFSHDGRFLAAGRRNGTIALRDLTRGEAVAVDLPGHASRVQDLEFHPRRPLLASASFDSTLRLWDVERPDALPLVLEGHDHWVWSLAFRGDGEQLVSASSDRGVRSWTTSSAALAKEICRHVGRNLTRREWAEYLPEGEKYKKTCSNLPAGGP